MTGNYQGKEKQSSFAKQQHEEAFQKEISNQQSVEDGIKCVSCGTVNPPEAEYCLECGSMLNAPLFCPHCGKPVNPGADICTFCGEWLLDGRCKFCYAEIPDDASFCPECGNDKNGIVCPSCGTKSIFDFCSKCNKPLTEYARSAAVAAQKDPEAKNFIETVRESISLERELSEIERLIEEAGKNKEGQSPSIAAVSPVKPSFFSDAQIKEILGSEKTIAKAEKIKEEEAARNEQLEEQRIRAVKDAEFDALMMKKAELEKKKSAAEKAANEAMLKFRNKKFTTQQEARRYHMAMKPPEVTGWLCNFTNTVHLCPEGPNACDEPKLGGYWYTGGTIDVNIKGPS